MWVPLEGKTLLNISNLLAHPFNVMTAEGFKHESERLGMEYTGVDSAFDPAKEVENLELGISREFDAVVYAAVDASAGTIAIDRIRRAGPDLFQLGFRFLRAAQHSLAYTPIPNGVDRGQVDGRAAF